MIHLNIKQLREATGISQTQAAKSLGIARNTLGKWENFPGEVPISKLIRLLVSLGYDLEITLKRRGGSARRGE